MLEIRKIQELVIHGGHMPDAPINGDALFNVNDQVVGHKTAQPLGSVLGYQNLYSLQRIPLFNTKSTVLTP